MRDKPSRMQQLEVEQLERREETGNKNTANKSLKEQHKSNVHQQITAHTYLEEKKSQNSQRHRNDQRNNYKELRTEMQGAEQISTPLILQLHISNLPAHILPQNSQKNSARLVSEPEIKSKNNL